MSRLMSRLVIDAKTVVALLEQSPEIKVELLKNASAQITEQFKRKVLNDQSKIVDELIREINSRLNYKYHLPENVLSVIRSATEDHVAKLNEQYASEHAKKAFDVALSKIEARLESKIDAMATTAIEKKLANVFAAAARLK